MLSPAEGFVRRPVLALRVGVTGARRLTPEAAAALGPQLAAVLGRIRRQVLALAEGPAARALYAAMPPQLRLVSALAEGADRLIATEALALGYQLEAPLPFARAEYERDFPATAAAFSALLAAAGERVLELDGARGTDETRSYEAVGRLVVHNCDILIAVWDGLPARGRGGTAEIVAYAAETGRPVWWLDAGGGGAARWIDGPDHLYAPTHYREGAAAAARLEAFLSETIAPARLAPVAAVLFAEKPRPQRAIWKTYAAVMAWAAWPHRAIAAPAGRPPPADAQGAYWHALYSSADRLAVDYGQRYRSSFVLVVILASVALGCAILGLQFHAQAVPVTVAEFLLLSCIAAFVMVNQRQHWHGRLIAYRLLAELFRKQAALAPLGWVLPVAERAALAEDPGPLTEPDGRPDPEQERAKLIGWYFNAMLRAAPLPRGSLGGAALTAIHQSDDVALINEQIGYHAARERAAAAAARRFSALGTLFFLGTLAIVGIKLLLLGLAHRAPHAAADDAVSAPIIAVGLAAALLPAASAAFVGIRSYAELELLAHQSAYMQGVLARARARLDDLDLDAPLASQALGQALLSIAEAMLLDVRGWAQIFRAKVLVPGG